MDLKEYIRTHPPVKHDPFVPSAIYNVLGDQIEVYFEDVPSVAESVPGKGLTLLRAMDDRRVVGVKVLDVRRTVR